MVKKLSLEDRMKIIFTIDSMAYNLINDLRKIANNVVAEDEEPDKFTIIFNNFILMFLDSFFKYFQEVKKEVAEEELEQSK